MEETLCLRLKRQGFDPEHYILLKKSRQDTNDGTLPFEIFLEKFKKLIDKS